MTSPLDEALRRTSEAAGRYGVPEKMIAAAASSLIRVRCPQRAELELGALHDAILTVADMHGGVHPGCPTCGAIGNALAVAMGVVRAEVDVEFAAKFGE